MREPKRQVGAGSNRASYFSGTSCQPVDAAAGPAQGLGPTGEEPPSASRWAARGRVTLACLLTWACGGGHLPQLARNGDLPALRAAIAQEGKTGHLDADATSELALALAQRELASARGDAGVQRVRELRPCAGRLRSELESRSERLDAPAAAATQALLELGALEPLALVEAYQRHPDGAFRTLAARASVGPELGPLRRRFMLDGDQRVRRGALHAAFASRHLADERALLEAARLDPDPLVRSLAIQTLGALGSRRSVLGLRDLWGTSSESQRQVIVGAWGKAPSLSLGGRRELKRVVQGSSGLPALVAARALVVSDDEAGRVLGAQRLSRFLRDGTAEEQVLAIQLSLPSETLSLELRRLAAEGPVSTRVAAHIRLLETEPDRRPESRAELEAFLESEDLGLRWRARSVLSGLGSSKARSAALAESRDKDASVRWRAYSDLLRLQDWQQVSLGLADPVAHVRTQLACKVLLARR